MRAHRQLRTVNIWPGFVDALTSLVLAFIFVLLIFVIAQFTLSEVLTGRDEALKRLNRQIAELADVLSLERKANADLRLSVAQLSAELQSSTLKRDTLSTRLSEVSGEREKLNAQLAEANARAENAAEEAGRLKGQLDTSQKQLDTSQEQLETTQKQLETTQRTSEGDKAALEAETKLSAEAQQQVELLNRQILALREQLAAIQQALEASEAANKNKEVQIADLGKRLNIALASKVEELARYRSEFLGRLREILGNRPEIRIVGDRFVFQSEVLFPSGSADLNPQGRETLKRLAQTLAGITPKIPATINWILEVDGYTDKRPIATPRFRSNWELSSARATAVVKFLIASGIPPEHLSAAGFGEYQPIDAAENAAAYAKNRRIELKLTQR
ncbi:MAG TPA: peptidoglycan -binding protein [Alphaproteobacteria bacterium]|nr:peptidoglycan -binding protein [Alphaproteobacteria bacterium]